MEYLVIDGYNVVNAWRDILSPDTNSLEECREKLLSILSNYQGYKKSDIIVVFDAHLVKGSREKQELFDNITVVFTKENETADNYIEKFVYKFGSVHTIKVVTSDYLEQTIIMSSGGIRMSTRELREEVEQVTKKPRATIANNANKRNTIMSHLESKLLEKLEKIRRDES